MPANTLALWHEWNSVHSYKVRIVLAEKDLAWTSHPLELLRFEHLAPEYLAINPDAVVPTLIHDGQALFDSTPICEYLDECFAEPALMPRDARMRLQIRRWLKYHDDIAHAAVRDASFQLLYKPVLAAMPRYDLEELVALHPRPERRRKFLDGANPQIDWDVLLTASCASLVVARRINARLEEIAGGQHWLEGEAFTLADVAMAPFAERIANLGCGFFWDGLDAGAAWSHRLLSRPSIHSTRPPQAFRLRTPDDATISELRMRLAARASE